MPEMRVYTGGSGGHYADILNRARRQGKFVELEKPILIETLDHGMQSGAPSVAMVLELPGGGVVLAETSLKLFQFAAYATMAKYGDVTGGALSGKIDRGEARLEFSGIEKCPSCHTEIPGSCKFCMECGQKL